MNINAGETKKIQTATHGVVEVENFNDKSLHFRWMNKFGRQDNGYISFTDDGEVNNVRNVSQKLLNEVFAAL